jgi:hypothetical protein
MNSYMDCTALAASIVKTNPIYIAKKWLGSLSVQLNKDSVFSIDAKKLKDPTY